MNNRQSEKIYTVSEASKKLRISESTMRRILESGDLIPKRQRGHKCKIIITESDILQLIENFKR